ncbi:hypothetical protein JIN84_00755 [Luteolibacter yonseiensis]|uniref:Uncharacterized protein n=1 Tax=Luteolibacter yonseiensis TaxID=1144680 RepID=A0A934QZX5_9BACT|nr:hypothetical protein [Luteolibacter yonseiensis]MBK1814137.1 hypothetical protein [Luteolibacter yonseiensis]
MTHVAELNKKAKAILFRELGPVDYARFFQQFEDGVGNYTTDRSQWLAEETVQGLHEEVKSLLKSGELMRPTGARLYDPASTDGPRT